MHWYYFSVSRWYRRDNEDVNSPILADAYLSKVDGHPREIDKTGSAKMRQRSNDLFDFPGNGTSLWSGYVRAKDEESALKRIERR